MTDLGGAGQRLSRVRELTAREPMGADGSRGSAASLGRLCRAATRSAHVSGAAIGLMNERGPVGIVAGSGDEWRRVAELPFVLGEGPCWDAFESRRPVVAHDLGDPAEERWRGYSAAAGEAGVRAVFSFPLKIGLARLGVLEVYRTEAGLLGARSFALALDFAELTTSLLVEGQERAGEGGVPSGIDEALATRYQAYQAQGMVMIQLGVSLPDALARLRAHAYANDRTLGDVACDVVARTLVFERDGPGPGIGKGSGT